MKTPLLLFISALFISAVCATDFTTWTNRDGIEAILKLVDKEVVDNKEVGVFEMKNGKKVSISIDDLSEESAKRLEKWEKEETKEEADLEAKSVFDGSLEGNLQILQGRSLRSYQMEKKPSKHYIFYYSASWCGPCQRYSPDLVRFYKRNHRKYEGSFELILVSADREEDAMADYVKKHRMPWPVIKYSEVKSFRQQHQHGITGIPSVVVCDLQGKVVAKTRDFSEIEKVLKN